MYQYTATVLKVVDGDTVHLMVDLGFDVQRKDSFRLYGINAPEMSTSEGVAARDWLVHRLTITPTLVVTTFKDKREKYGRYLAKLWDGYGQGFSINDEMVAEGHAVEYTP